MNKFVLILLIFISACSGTEQDNYAVLYKKNIKCPDGAVLEYSTWGTHGVIAKCKIMHGPYFAAKNGRIVIEGQNNMGKSSGGRWLDENGKVEKEWQN